MKRILAFIILAVGLLNGSAFGGPGRAIIQNGTIKTADGQRLVGIDLVYAEIIEQQIKDMVKSYTSYTKIRDSAHYNCVRFCDINMRFDNKPLVSSVFPVMDSVIAYCGRLGMYVILDYHSMPIWDGSAWDIRNYWDQIAQRYKDVTWVMYEMTNEPTGNSPKDTNDWMMSWAKETYVNHMRKWAPNTMILHWASTSIVDYWAPFLKQYATALHFTWTNGNDAFSFHTYWISASQYILDLRTNGIPSMCTEASYEEDGWGCPTLDGCKRQQEWLIKHDISYSDWISGENGEGWYNNPKPWDHAIKYAIPDALAKGYAWWTGSIVIQGSAARSQSAVARYPKGRFYDILGRSVAPEKLRGARAVVPMRKGGAKAGSLMIH
jgi:hypothetical protein